MSKKLTKEEFIAKARVVHGDRYDYTLVNYVGSSQKVTIICPIEGHGTFEQRANDHLRGSGCPKCKGERISESRRSNTDDFIAKAKEIHGSKYQYHLVDYVGSSQKVTIICPIEGHGTFEQRANDHLRGSGCPKCKGERISESRRSNTDDFIAKAKEIHGSKYQYHLVDYVNARTKVTIICPKHGKFEQEVYSHLRGSGCPTCAVERDSESKRSNTEDFIAKVRDVHGSKYEYHEVDYVNNRTKVTIICPDHGEFEQRPSSHLSGNGCPTCAKVENILKQKDDPTNLYWLELRHNITGEIFHKVGVTYAHCDDNRFTKIQKDSDSTILKVYMRHFESRFEAEYQEQRILARVRDGWVLDKNLKKIRRLPKSKRLSTKFKFDKPWAGSTECFTPRKIPQGFKRISLNSISGNEVTDNA